MVILDSIDRNLCELLLLLVVKRYPPGLIYERALVLEFGMFNRVVNCIRGKNQYILQVLPLLMVVHRREVDK